VAGVPAALVDAMVSLSGWRLSSNLTAYGTKHVGGDTRRQCKRNKGLKAPKATRIAVGADVHLRGYQLARKIENRDCQALNRYSVFMKKARKFENEESISIPTNHLLSIFRDSHRSKDVVEALHRSGFSREEIGVLSGEEGVAKFDSASGRR
jgi:hypothetical protein